MPEFSSFRVKMPLKWYLTPNISICFYELVKVAINMFFISCILLHSTSRFLQAGVQNQGAIKVQEQASR